MREANFLDLWGTFHYIVAAGFLIVIFVEGYFLRRLVKKRSPAGITILTIIVLGTLGFGIVLRGMFFPGGGLYDTRYDSDRVWVSMVQDDLKTYKETCNSYPTTQQGLQALVQIPPDVNCPNYKPHLKRVPDFKYVSDGATYEIESTRPYHIEGLLVRGTHEMRSRLFIKR